MNTNQKYYPEFGYDVPRSTKEKCDNPAFAEPTRHRIGILQLSITVMH